MTIAATRHRKAHPSTVHGTPGASLRGEARWAENDTVVAIARRGEEKTGRLLNALRGVTVFHDIAVPRSRANIDHLVVSGRTIHLIDTKVWKPGIYWGNPPRRGRHLFPAAQKLNLTQFGLALQRYLHAQGVTVTLGHSIYAVWPSTPGLLNLRFLPTTGGARLLTGKQLASRAHRYFQTQPADPAVVANLLPLLNS